MSEKFINLPNIEVKSKKEILSDFMNCYGLLDNDQDIIKESTPNSHHLKQEYLRDLEIIYDLGIINAWQKDLKLIQYQLPQTDQNEKNSNIYNLENIDLERVNDDTDLEILKYRQARKDIANQKISLLHLRPQITKEILNISRISKWHNSLYKNVYTGLHYLRSNSNIAEQSLNDFENNHGLEDILLKSQHVSMHEFDSSRPRYDKFRLIALFYYEDWKINLNDISLLDIDHKVTYFVGETNKKFIQDLETILFKAHAKNIINNLQLRALQNHYRLNNIMLNFDKYDSHIEIDIDTVSHFDKSNAIED